MLNDSAETPFRCGERYFAKGSANGGPDRRLVKDLPRRRTRRAGFRHRRDEDNGNWTQFTANRLYRQWPGAFEQRNMRQDEVRPYRSGRMLRATLAFGEAEDQGTIATEQSLQVERDKRFVFDDQHMAQTACPDPRPPDASGVGSGLSREAVVRRGRACRSRSRPCRSSQADRHESQSWDARDRCSHVPARDAPHVASRKPRIEQATPDGIAPSHEPDDRRCRQRAAVDECGDATVARISAPGSSSSMMTSPLPAPASVPCWRSRVTRTCLVGWQRR